MFVVGVAYQIETDPGSTKAHGAYVLCCVSVIACFCF